jgi:hypothetical protein
MNAYQMYIAITIVVLALVTLLFYLGSRNKPSRGLTPLAGLAFAFILAGILFGSNRVIGYGLLGVGVILAVIDIVNKSKNK